MKTVLLTGASGFLGSHLLKSLLINNYNVIITKRSTSNIWRIENLLEKIKSYDVDILPIEQIFAENGIDIVINTVCSYGRNNESISNIVESNLLFGVRLLDACIKHNTKLFINTDTLLRKDLSFYSLSKKHFVEYLQQSSDKIQVINFKIEHMYGPKDDSTKFVSWILQSFKSNAKSIDLTVGEQLRDFIYIENVVTAFLLAMLNCNVLSSFNEFDVGTGNLIRVKDFLLKLKSLYEAEFGKVRTILNFGAVPYRDGEMMSVDVDNSALLSLGWEPDISLEQGIKNILKEI